MLIDGVGEAVAEGLALAVEVDEDVGVADPLGDSEGRGEADELAVGDADGDADGEVDGDVEVVADGLELPVVASTEGAGVADAL